MRLALAGLIVASAVFASASVMVGAGQATVITRFGDLPRVLTTPGLAWKLPTPIKGVIPVDLRLRTTSTGLQDVGIKEGLRVLVQACRRLAGAGRAVAHPPVPPRRPQ